MAPYESDVKVDVPSGPRSLKSSTSFSVRELLETPGLEPELAKRIQDADRDGSGGLSIQEVLAVFKSEQAAVSERRWMRR